MKNIKSYLVEYFNPIVIVCWIASLFFEIEYKLMTTLIIILLIFNFLLLKNDYKQNLFFKFVFVNKYFAISILFFLVANSFNILFIHYTLGDYKFVEDFLKYSVFFYIPFLFKYSEKSMHKVFLYLLIVAILFAISGIYDYFILGFDRAGNIPTLYSYLLLLLFPFCIVWFKLKNKCGHLTLIIAILLLGALILTKTRACWVAFTVSLLVILFLIRKKITFKNIKYPIIVISLLMLTSAPILYQRMQDTINYKTNYSVERIYIWKSSIQMAKNNLLLGIGQDRKRFKELYDNKYHLAESREKHIAHPHNSFLYFLVRNGIMGLISFLLFQFFQIKYFLKLAFNENRIIKILALVGIWFFTVTIVGSFFDAYFHFTKIQKAYWALLGFIIASIEFYKTKLFNKN